MARRNDSDDDRPKRSWSEIDKMRDKAFSRGQAQEQRKQERAERSPVYGQYKAQVSKMFSGGELPDALREKLDPTGALKARDDLLKRIRKTATEDRKAWAEAVTELVEGHDLPEDVYLLADFLDHPKDAIVLKVLEHLERMTGSGALTKKPAAIVQRLRSLELASDDPDVQAKAKALREKMR
jgi:hypothetical protein